LLTRNFLLTVFFIILIFITFSFGIYIGAFKIYPYEIFDSVFDNIQTKNEIIPLSNPSFDILSIIKIKTVNDILEKREELIFYIFKNNDSFYKKIPTTILQNIHDENYSDLKNLKTIDKFLIEMEYGVSSNVYLFSPITETQNLIIYHHGHYVDLYNEKQIIQSFLDNNYAVLVISMPLTGQNSNPIINLEKFGTFNLNYHDDLIFLESSDFSPLIFFIEPISSSINYLDQNYSFSHYYMMGISGGGWTTGVYSALDTRIEKSFPVAGTSPMFLKFNNPDNFGDYEQMNLDFYNIANYLEQYVMASNGENRKQLQIFNKNDPCCFSGDDYLIYEDDVQNILSQIGNGKFSIHIDENNLSHTISSDSLNLILNELKN
jgi:hypothetical protein